MRRGMLAGCAVVLLTYALITGCGGGLRAGTLATDDPTDAATTDTGTTETGTTDTAGPDAPSEVGPSTPTPTATPTDTGSIDEPAGPRPPAAARAPTRPGAKAFVRFYVEQLSIGYGFGNVDGMRANSTESCGLCRDYAHEYETIARSGGWVRGDPLWRADTVSIERFDPDRSTVAVALRIGEHSYADSAVEPEQHSPERSYAFSFDLLHDGDRWLVNAASAENT